MRYICPACGSEIPQDSDFCYACGRKKDNTIRLDQSGHFIEPEKNSCASCGAELAQASPFCPNCGEPRSRTQMGTFRPKLIKYGWIGLALAFIPGALGFLPGLFSVFGLGHLYFKRWGRGVMYLASSVLLFYIRFVLGEVDFWMSLFITIPTCFFFLLQAMEVLMLAFTPPKTAE